MTNARVGCGAHQNESSSFDHTCDDCMLPQDHRDPEDDPTYRERKEEYANNTEATI